MNHISILKQSMIFRALLSCAMVILLTSANAQYKTVVYDLEKNFFNEGQPLPFETHIMLNGQVPNNVDLIEVEVRKGGGEMGMFCTVATGKEQKWIRQSSTFQ